MHHRLEESNMMRTVTVPLDELESLLFSAVERGLKNGGVFEKAGLIGPDIVLRTTHGLAAAGRITVQGNEVPPFRPDPDLIGNAEGNRRILAADQEATRRYLEEQGLTP